MAFSHQHCNSCATEYKAINDSLRAEIVALQSTDGLLANNNAIILTQNMIETLGKRAETFSFEIGVRESKLQMAAAFEAESLEQARLNELSELQGIMEESKVKKEHVIIAGAGVLAVSFLG